MGTYISHLRNAQILFFEIDDLDPEAFLIGNMAPDSGTPNQDWTQFDPPRVVSHFLDQGGEHSRDFEFYRKYLRSKESHTAKRKYSFLLGYFIHLICDNLWLLWIVEASKRDYEVLLNTQGSVGWDILKQDWYDLDRRYVLDHSESKFWQIFMQLEYIPRYLPYLSGDAILQQVKHIREIYIASTQDRQLDRSYPYLSAATLDRFVEESSDVVLEILSRREELNLLGDSPTALTLIPGGRLLPYDRLS